MKNRKFDHLVASVRKEPGGLERYREIQRLRKAIVENNYYRKQFQAVAEYCDECEGYHDMGEKKELGVCPFLYRKAIKLKYEHCVFSFMDWEYDVRFLFILLGCIAFFCPIASFYMGFSSAENCAWLLACTLPLLVFLGYASSISLLREWKKNKLEQRFEREFPKESSCLGKASRLGLEVWQYF